MTFETIPEYCFKRHSALVGIVVGWGQNKRKGGATRWEAVRAAMQQWNKVRDTKGKSIVSLYLTTGATDSRVIYSNYSFPKIGYTEHILRGDEILGATIHLASTEKWSVGYSPGCYDIQTVVLHELGHMLGVAHCHEDGSEPPCFSKTCESNVMNPYVSPGKIKRTFQEYDTASYIIIYD